MNYKHQFIIHASLEKVVAFHSRSESMGTITPPPIIAQIHKAPTILKDGDKMEFTLWMGPFPIRWLAEIEQLSPTSFIDRQLKGPFAKWEHTHTFASLPNGQVEIRDEIMAEYRPELFWKMVGMGMWLNMPILFAFRAWKTKRVLAQNNSTDQEELQKQTPNSIDETLQHG